MSEQLLDQPLGTAAAISGAIAEALARVDAGEDLGQDEQSDRDDFTSGGTGSQPRRFMDFLTEALTELGLSMEDVRDLAESLNITLMETEGGFATFGRQLAELDLAQAFETFAGRMGMLRREFELFDVDKPMDRVRMLLDVLDAFTDLDLPSADDGAEAIDQFIRTFFTGLRDMDPEEMAARFGGLSVSQILDILGEIESAMDGLEDGAADGVTRGFQVSRTITEVTGNRLVGTMTTVAFWAERSAVASEQIVALMGGSLAPPSKAALMAYRDRQTATEFLGASMTVNIGDIVLPSVTDPEAASQAIAATIRENVDRALGARMLDTRRARGRGQPDGLRN
jgi:hypothetical protein